MVLDLVAQVAGEDVEEPAAVDVAGTEELPHVPACARLVRDLLFAEIVHPLREVTAEDDHVCPHVPDDVGNRVGREHVEEERTGEERPENVVLERLVRDLLPDAAEHRVCLGERPLAGQEAVYLQIVQGDEPLEQESHHDRRDRLQQVERMPPLLRGDAEHAVAHVAILAEDIRPRVMHDVVGMLPLIRRTDAVPLPRARLDVRVAHPVPLRVHDVVADLHVLQDLRHGQQQRAECDDRQEPEPLG